MYFLPGGENFWGSTLFISIASFTLKWNIPLYIIKIHSLIRLLFSPEHQSRAVAPLWMPATGYRDPATFHVFPGLASGCSVDSWGSSVSAAAMPPGPPCDGVADGALAQCTLLFSCFVHHGEPVLLLCERGGLYMLKKAISPLLKTN